MIDVTAALESLRSVDPVGPWPAGAPDQDYTRSPAAARVGRLAEPEGLFLFDFEQRVPLDLPDHWVEPGREDDAAEPGWIDGQLPERKYQSFCHDLMIGSFHPGHRGKWTTHELCHALVGFHWRPGASLLEHATAARLAELLPVSLYYFFDEVGLKRCPDHAGGGPLFRESCSACEAIAAFAEPAPGDRGFLEEGVAFLERELAAVARTRRTGRPVSHRWGSLDLTSDGLAYARAHGRRLNSEAMAHCERFLIGNAGSLDALEARVVEVARGLLLGEPIASHGADRDAFIRADVAFRMLTVWEETEGEAADAILELLEDIGPATPAAWTELEEEYDLPTAEQVFSVGYPFGELGCSDRSIRMGLESVCPLVCEVAEDADVSLAFRPPAERRPLGDRFVDWLEVNHPALAPLARLETAMRAVRADPIPSALGIEGSGLELSPEVRLLRTPYDVVQLSESVDSGSISGVVVDGRLELTPAPEPAPSLLALARDPSGELVMAELPADLSLDDPSLLDEETTAMLLELGVLRRSRWDV